MRIFQHCLLSEGGQLARKSLIALLVTLCLMHPLPAVSEEEERSFNTAFTALYNGVFSAAAAYASIPRVILPGVSIVDSDGASALTARLSFNRSDLSTYILAFAPSSSDSATWYQRLIQSARDSISPLSRLAASLLFEADYHLGSAILDGSIVVSFKDPGTSNIRTWFDLMVLRDWSSVRFDVDVSVLVSGTLTGVPIAFEGILEGSGESDGTAIVLRAIEMKCNGTEVTMSPIRLTIIQKESLSDAS